MRIDKVDSTGQDPFLAVSGTTGCVPLTPSGQIVGFSVGAPWYAELFAARLRYSGASLAFQIGAAISGGLTPFAAATFMGWTGGATWPISVYLIVLALITSVATMAAPEMAGKPLK